MPTQSSKILRYAGLALLPLTFLFTVSAQEGGLSVDDIVKKNIDARGGMDKIKAVQSIKMTGKLVMGGGQMEAPMTMQIKRPSFIRMDMEFQGQAVVQGYDGETAWMINPFTGGADAAKMSDDDAEGMKEGADLEGALVDYKTKGHKIALVGKEDLSGKPAYKLKVDKKNGKTETVYVDATSFLEVKTVAMRKIMGNEMEMETFATDYKPVAGVMMPYSIDSKSGGNSVMTITLDKVEANVAVEASLFKMPAPK
jgi:outer membrane lipoprotein-sorting protein